MSESPEAVRAEAEKLLAEITPGEWRLWNGWGPASDGRMRVERIGTDDPHAWLGLQTTHESPDISGTKGDLEFIATAPRLVRDLLAALTLQQQENIRLREYVQHKPECALNCDVPDCLSLHHCTCGLPAADAGLVARQQDRTDPPAESHLP